MKRLGLLFASASWTLALAAVGLHVGLGPPPTRVNVRWAEAASDAEKARIERELGLASGEHREGRTWSYVLLNQSRQNIAGIVGQPLIEDTHHIDRTRFTLERDAPTWIKRLLYVRPIRPFADRLLLVALVSALVGLIGLWPHRRRVAAALRHGLGEFLKV